MSQLIAAARRVHALAVGNLDYVADAKTTGRADDWRSHAALLIQNPTARYKGDCDDCAFTAAELALHFGVPANAVRVVMVDTERRGDPKVVNHMVCAIGIDGEDPWIIDNCWAHAPMRVADLAYTWGSGMRASEPGVWRATIMD